MPETRRRRFTLPAAKSIVAALFPIVQTALSLYSDQNLSKGELKEIGVLVGAAVLVWLVPAPGYAAPGETAVPKEAAAEAGYYGQHEDRDRDGVPDKVELELNQDPVRDPTKRRIKDNPQA